ncbi:hypothetical protein [Sulfurimonas sp.]|uniref:hypothetical protein n=1 Tax=Sulfurimonas sp. TaxID=2022749 RepID=UPI002635E71E|nr:hypothetical protein [Sulfurimonas sp.]
MKKIVLSALAALTLGSVAANAGALKLYQDANGQVFTQAGEGRTAIKTPTSVFSHADKLKFDGQAFIGYKNTQYDDSSKDSTQDFEVRRGYFQLKAYLLDDPKSYYRVTMDLTREKSTTANTNGSMIVRAKYAYLNLNEVLPATSLEIGLAHRPWHDYEEHNSWMYRSISEILIENGNSAHISSSADFGVMAKTRTKYFDADYGVFNGEGYHSAQNSNGMSLEWRFTGHLLGTHGHPEKTTYLDASFFGQLNQKHSKNAVTGHEDDLHFYGFHAVYNMPAFLASAQYVTSEDTSTNSSATGAASKGSGDGYSFNVEGRVGEEHQYKAFARVDKWTPDVNSGATKYDKNTYIGGVAWKQNSNVEWVANVTIDDNDHATGTASPKSTSYMLTTQIDF